MTKKTKLTPKKKLFCELYHDSWNAGKAYQEVFGVGIHTARVSGCRLLMDDNVKRYLAKLSHAKRVETHMARQKLEEYLWKVLNADLSDGIAQRDENGKIIKLPDKETMKFVTKITGGKNPKLEMFSKEKAAELLARMTGAIKPDILMQDKKTIPGEAVEVTKIQVPENGRENADS